MVTIKKINNVLLTCQVAKLPTILSNLVNLASWQIDKNMKISKNKAMTRTQLATFYGVCLVTFNKMLVKIPNFTFDKSSRILTPKEIDTIINHLGDPFHPD